MILIRKALVKDVEIISRLANEIWWDCYKDIISDHQISFMLSKMYSHESLTEQLFNEITFLILVEHNVEVGFAAYSKSDIDKNYKLDKLYLHKTIQGKGLGKELLNKVENEVKLLGSNYLYLNVNRNNPAYNFYLKMGYQVTEIIDIPYFAFVLNDYIMRKALV